MENTTVKQAEQDKHKFYEKNYFLNGGQVVPGAIDSFGRWGDELMNIVVDIARSGSSSEKKYSKTVNRLRTVLAVTLVRSVGKQIAVFLAHHFY